jgi:sodium transport system permease protein
MSWSNVKLIFLRELRDQLRDRRTLFTIVVLPLLLYPLLGMCFLQVQQFLKEHDSRVRIVGAEHLPAEPALLVDGRFSLEVTGKHERDLLEVEVADEGSSDLEELRIAAQSDIAAGLCDVVVYFPPDFAARLAEFRQAQPTGGPAASDSAEDASGSVPEPLVFLDSASEKSKIARTRVEDVLRRWRETMVENNLRESRVPVAAVRPFELKQDDVAEDSRRRAALWSKILPFIVMVWALTGAFYPAIDLCAGEKERGTLETLLSSPAQRGEIVWGKLLTVMTFSMATALLNLAITTGMATFVITRLEVMGAANLRVQVGPPPLAALAWLVLALPPVAALFSALSLAIAAFARSSKEGQYYLMPLLMVSLPLMLLPMLPQTELDLGFSLIPVTGLMLLLRTLIEGQFLEAVRYALPVIGVTAVCCWLALRWAVDQFNNESVLFRESERLDLGLWIKHLVRDRLDTPTVGEAVLCGVLLLVIQFFAIMIPPPHGWNQFMITTLVLQVALIATPACLMAIMLTRSPVKTLSLGRPSFLLTLPAAVLLAACLHPATSWLSEAIRFVYPLNPSIVEKLEQFGKYATTEPLWQVLLLIAVTPAICEELAFRGFILSGLRRLGHKWTAIALTAVFFGLAHGLLQQSLAACAVGMVIGYVAVKTGSLWPGVLFHMTHNGLSVLQARITPELHDSQPLLRMLLVSGAEPGSLHYSITASIVLGLVAAGILWWFKSLPYHASAEERLQDALDHQVALPAKTPA